MNQPPQTPPSKERLLMFIQNLAKELKACSPKSKLLEVVELEFGTKE